MSLGAETQAGTSVFLRALSGLRGFDVAFSSQTKTEIVAEMQQRGCSLSIVQHVNEAAHFESS